MNVSTEIVMGALSALGAGLTAVVTKMWLWFTSELRECKEDRKALHGRTEELHVRIGEISTVVGRLEGKLSQMTEGA